MKIKRSTTLIYGRGTDADTLDPLNSSIGETVKVLVNIYDTLVAYDDETLEIVPSLAEDWVASKNQLEWTFQLRKDVKFHDGTDCNADAIVFNFQRLIQEDHEHLYDAERPYRPHFTVIKSVEATGPLTVKFVLAQPNAVFINNLAMFAASIVSPTALKKHGADFGNHPSGTGPFELQTWERDQRLILKRFAGYWRKGSKLDRLIFKPVRENAVRAQQLDRSEIHITDNLPPAEVDVLAQKDGIQIQHQMGLNVGYLAIHTQKPPLNHAKVRAAIWHAIDKKRLIDVAFSGHGKPAVNLVPATMWGHNDQLKDRQYDPTRAKQLLDQAIQEHKLKTPLTLELYFMKQARPYMQQPRQIAIYIGDALSEIGIKTNLVPHDARQHFQRLSAGDHHLGLAGWSSDNADPDNFLFSLLDKTNINDKGGNNLCRYDNEEVHQMLVAAQQELDKEKRKKLYFDIQKKVYDDIPAIPLVHTEVRIAHRDIVKGYKLHPSAMVRLRHAYMGSGSK